MQAQKSQFFNKKRKKRVECKIFAWLFVYNAQKRLLHYYYTRETSLSFPAFFIDAKGQKQAAHRGKNRNEKNKFAFFKKGIDKPM